MGSVDETVIGRAAESGQLDELLSVVEHGSAAVAVVTGPPGIGKTFLIRAALRRRPEVRAVWATVRLGAAIPRPFEFLRAVLSGLGVPEAQTTDALEASARLQERPDALSGWVADRIERFSGDRPLVLVCDNLEQSDQESLRVLDGVARRLYAEPVLLVLVGRADPAEWLRAVSGSGWAAPQVRIALRGWSPEEMEAAARVFAPHSAVHAASRLRSLGEGNPLYVKALLAEEERSSTAGPAPFGVPDSLQLPLGDTLPGLTVAQHGVVRALAVLGGSASTNDVAAVSGDPDVAEPIVSLVGSGVLRDGQLPGEVSFASAVYRDLVYRDIPSDERRNLHRRAIAVSTGESLWRHRLAAGDEDQTGLAAEIDAEARREADGDPARAARFLIWAAALGSGSERGPRLLEGVRLLAISAHEAEASRYAADVEALPASPERSEVQALLAFGRAQPGRARDLLREALADERVNGDPLVRARVNMELSCVASLIGLGAEAVAAAAEVAVSEATPAEKSAALAFGALGRAFIDGPDAGLKMLEALPDNPSECTRNDIPQLVHRGILRGLLGRLTNARADLIIASRRQQPATGEILGSSAHIHLTWCSYLLGNWAEAMREAQAGLVAAELFGRGFDAPVLHSLASILHASVGDVELAERDAAEARARSDAADYFGPVIHLAISRAAVARALGDLDGAYETIASLSPRSMEEDRYRLFHVWWLPVLADLQITTGRLDAAERTMDALKHAPATGAWIPVTRTWLNGRIAEARGDKARARSLYERALEIKGVGGEPLWARGQLLESYSGLLVSTGETARGVRALKRTAQVYATVGARPALERVQRRIEELDLPAPAPWARELSSREHEIAEMVGRGWTNPEVAAELAISPKTVEYHLGKIYAKLGTPNRRALRDLVVGDS